MRYVLKIFAEILIYTIELLDNDFGIYHKVIYLGDLIIIDYIYYTWG